MKQIGKKIMCLWGPDYPGKRDQNLRQKNIREEEEKTVNILSSNGKYKH